jgi:peptidoglycan/LPS O-acetylase OafA/YrhL
MKFRSDINGLRAYAVIAVMLFHFGVPGFSGGFIGVDVFFVISGYLMTRMIIEGIDRSWGGHWSWLLSFYLARARRIIPALLVLCVTLLAIGWFTLPSTDYRQLGTHVIAALSFLSNIKFWREAGYFDAASHEKWLLHTWSLSVEWQFYLLFPILLIMLWRLLPGRRVVTIALIVGLVVSLGLSISLTPGHPSAAFYLLPMRAWELFAGGLVYLLVAHRRPRDKPARWLEGLGFGIIVGSAMLLSADTPWPGALATIPVLGTVLVLIAARQTSAWAQPGPLQALGNWSYSIYLWHWPLAVALIYLEIADRPLPVFVAMAISILLGWLSYTWVESPARRRLARQKPLFVTAAVSALVLLVALPSVAIYKAEGVPGRLASQVERISSEALNFNYWRRANCHGWGGDDFKSCVHGGEQISAILVGDSHASAVATAVQQALPNSKQGLLTFTYTSCPTIFGVQKRDRPDLKCAEFNDWVMQEIAGLPPEIPLIIVNRTTGNVFGSNRPDEASHGKPSAYFSEPLDHPTAAFQHEFANRLAQSACRIAEKRPVYLVRPIPEMPVDVPKVAARKQLIGQPIEISVSLSDYHTRHALVWGAQDKASEDCGAYILDPLPWLCDDNVCDALREGRPLYYDSHHLSEFGNKYLVSMFRSVFTRN